jgi:hypothetical protein
MRKTLLILILLVVVASPASASAWDGAGMWQRAAADQNPGGGGIYATGGKGDYGLGCAVCHVGPAKQITATLTPTPAFQVIGSAQAYKPGQTYAIAVALNGEHLGLGACGAYTSNTNGFAATVEGVDGLPTGILASDSGQSAASCPATMPGGITSGTSVLFGDCRAVVARNGLSPGRTSWSFNWTAPPVGSGTATIWAGVVDGDCSMSSLGDDVAMVSAPLAEGSPTGAREPRGKLPFAALAGFAIAAAVGAAIRKRR